MLVKGPQVRSIGTLLSGEGEEEEARKQTRSATTDCDWIRLLKGVVLQKTIFFCFSLHEARKKTKTLFKRKGGSS